MTNTRNQPVKLLVMGLMALTMLMGSTRAIAQNAPGTITSTHAGGKMVPNACGAGDKGRGCDRNKFMADAAGQSTYDTGKYFREGSGLGNLSVTTTVPSKYPGGRARSYTARGQLVCRGGRNGKDWQFEALRGQDKCWDRLTLISTPNCAGERNRRTYRAKKVRGKATASNQCPYGACRVDYDGASGPGFIIGNTGDHQMAMAPVSSRTRGFFVNNYCEARPLWMERRSSPHGNKYLMIPSKCEDYGRFLNDPPKAVRLSGACHPASVKLSCPRPPSRPPQPAHPRCGSRSHGDTWCGNRCMHDSSICVREYRCDCGRTRQIANRYQACQRAASPSCPHDNPSNDPDRRGCVLDRGQG